jgi:hypothetical protein
MEVWIIHAGMSQEESLYECWLSYSLTNVSNTAVRGRKYLQRFRHAGPEAYMQLQFLSNQSNQKSKNPSKQQITLNQKCRSHLSAFASNSGPLISQFIS